MLITAGLLAGLVGGMLGLGGSIIMIPAMTELLGPDQHLYQAAAMIVNVFVGVPAVYQHRRAKAIQPATVARLLPVALVSVMVGVGFSEARVFSNDGEVYLRGLFGVFLGAIAMHGLVRRVRQGRPEGRIGSDDPRDHSRQEVLTWRSAFAIAGPAGFVGGLLGVGGGVLAVPLQRRFLGLPIRTAIANSSAIIVATSLVGAMVKNYALITDRQGSLKSLALALILIPTAIIGSLVGSRLTHRVPIRVVQSLLFALLIFAAIRLTHQAAQSLLQALSP